MTSSHIWDKLKLPNVPVEALIIDPDKYGLLDGPFNVVRVPTHNGEVIHPGMMICSVGIVIDGGGSPEMFLKTFPKSPCRLSYVPLIILYDVILVVRGNLKLPMVFPSLKWI